MFIENSQQDIEIKLPEYIKRVALRISGGADSAIVGYMLSKYVKEERPDIKIVPITVDQVGKNYQIKFAKRIIEFYKEQFGNIFLEHYTDVSYDESNYSNVQSNLQKKLYKEGIVDFHFLGLTLNPPRDSIPSFIFSEGWTEPLDRKRTGKLKPMYKGKRCAPLINIDKRGVAELYQTLGIMDTLFPLTRSCEVYTDDFSKHCERCWFCAERFYGFGRYE